MNVTRIAILAVAVIAAISAALLVSGMMGGGTPPVQASLPSPVTPADVLVASKDIPPGRILDVGRRCAGNPGRRTRYPAPLSPSKRNPTSARP